MLTTPTPKDRFTSLDTLALVRELRTLGRARVDKAFDLVPAGWSVVLRVPGTGRLELVLVPGRYTVVVAEGPEHAEALSPFAKELRRLLTGATLRSVAEPGGERLLELTLSRADEPDDLLLAFEMFGSGNLIIARGRKIAAVAYPRTWAHRAVRVGQEYQRPPTRSDPWLLSEAEIESELARSRSDLASTLAARLGLGGPLAEELIARGGWNPQDAAARDPPSIGRELHRILRGLWEEVGERPSGFVYLRAGAVVDATPYPSQRWRTSETVEEVRRDTFSRAAWEYFATLISAPPTAEENEAARARRDLERLAERQRRSVQELERDVASLRAQAETILAHYAEAESLLARSGPDEKTERTFEAELGGMTVTLRTGQTPRESAQATFEEAKRIQSKLVGAQNALADTERRRDAPIAPPPRRIDSAAERSVGRSRTRWFESYRWFVSSEGALVVAGRDAASNDVVVKRHLKAGDIYVHADVHGAASVVVKHPSPGAPPLSESTYAEAGQWAVAFSKAWRAGLAFASAFWVAHDQVSKSGASGEFVARGAWVVHGSKHLLRDLPTELALGKIEYEGGSWWTAAPPAALRARGTVAFLLTPGPERERDAVETRLVRELGVARPLLQRLLPAGGISARRP